jgi:hypothetical protein
MNSAVSVTFLVLSMGMVILLALASTGRIVRKSSK